MDRREAIGALEWLRLKAAKPIYSNMHEALDLAINALGVDVVRCGECRHNHNCDIQWAAHGSENFGCVLAERRE